MKPAPLPTKRPLRVLILDDLPEAQSWLNEIVQEAFPGCIVTIASTVKQALQMLTSGPPDLALIDLGLTDGSGVQVLHAARQLESGPYCIVTTIFDGDSKVFEALQAGAQGYLLKDRDTRELIDALRGITQDRPALSPPIAKKLLAHFQPSAHKDLLSNRERQVLELIAKGHTIKKTAQHLGLRPGTVAGYIKEIYRKLEVSSRAEAAVEAARLGII